MIASNMNAIETMTLTVNGKTRDVPQVKTVGELLRVLDLDPRQVVVELNEAIIRRQQVDEVLVREGDQVEILRFVGGG